jgi:hypothetical protein
MLSRWNPPYLSLTLSAAVIGAPWGGDRRAGMRFAVGVVCFASKNCTRGAQSGGAIVFVFHGTSESSSDADETWIGTTPISTACNNSLSDLDRETG